MRTLLLTLLLVAGGLVFAIPGPAYACSCAPPPPIDKAIEQSDAVFTGTVIASEPPAGGEIWSGAEAVTYTFTVGRVVAGDIGSEVEVTTAAMEVSCGIEFRENTRYVVFATAAGGSLETNLCTRTEPINETTGSFGGDLPGKSPTETEATPPDAALNPTSDSSEGTPVWPWIAGGGLVTAALLLALALRRASA
ncbi:MAG: hypothetical protein M3124_04405 [Actinomycetota bacterium]|nr:hypothetical protein [Actinomycetota bacterium]